MNKSASKIKLTGFDDLFGPDAKKEQVRDISLAELHPFVNHPFQVLDNDDMAKLVASIRLHGKVLEPAIARPRKAGGYELVSGHRRCHAAKLAGLSSMPVIVEELSDAEATIIMVDANLQREEILPSEKAFAYRMKYEALKHQGSQNGRSTAQAIGEEQGESGRNIQRYLRLTELIPELLKLVDEGKLKFIAAVDLSYLDLDMQHLVYEKLEKGVPLSGMQAAKLKKYSQEGTLTAGMAGLILEMEEKADHKPISLRRDRVRKYFPENYSSKEMEDTIIRLLEEWSQRERRN